MTSLNEGTLTNISNDTITEKNLDSINELRSSSSKSAIIIDKVEMKKDTIKKTLDSNQIILLEKVRRLMHHSSKSGILID